MYLAALLQLIMILYKLFLFFCVSMSSQSSAACTDAVKQVFFIQTLEINNVCVAGIRVKINPRVFYSSYSLALSHSNVPRLIF